MAAEKLKDCWLKIDRAKDHRDGLQRYIVDTFTTDGNRPEIAAKFDDQTGEFVLLVVHVPELGDFLDRCAIVLGETVHCLISALDYLAFALAGLHTGGKIQHPNRVQFPIADAPDRFEELRKRALTEIDPTHVAIIERYQGYHRIHDDYSVGRAFGFHPLSALRDLASMDKHKMLIRIMTPTALLQGMSWSPFSVEILELMQECASMMAVIARPLELGAEVCRVKVHGALQSEMDVKGYITPEVTLGEGQPIVHVVDRIAPVVIKIIREFEPFF